MTYFLCLAIFILDFCSIQCAEALGALAQVNAVKNKNKGRSVFLLSD